MGSLEANDGERARREPIARQAIGKVVRSLAESRLEVLRGLSRVHRVQGPGQLLHRHPLESAKPG